MSIKLRLLGSTVARDEKRGVPFGIGYDDYVRPWTGPTPPKKTRIGLLQGVKIDMIWGKVVGYEIPSHKEDSLHVLVDVESYYKEYLSKDSNLDVFKRWLTETGWATY